MPAQKTYLACAWDISNPWSVESFTLLHGRLTSLFASVLPFIHWSKDYTPRTCTTNKSFLALSVISDYDLAAEGRQIIRSTSEKTSSAAPDYENRQGLLPLERNFYLQRFVVQYSYRDPKRHDGERGHNADSEVSAHHSMVHSRAKRRVQGLHSSLAWTRW